jgi:cob(I)alamin adenosyltransferase
LLETLGALDEATCAIGLARAATQNERLRQALLTIQRHLSQLMAHLSATPAVRPRYPGLGNGDRQWLESLIVELEQDLPPVREFVLPGGSSAGAACHWARAIVRRAERRLVTLMTAEPDIDTANLAYLNRLSSCLFVAALCEDRVAVSLSKNSF